MKGAPLSEVFAAEADGRPVRRPRGRQQRAPIKSTARVSFDATPEERAWIDAHRGRTPRAEWVRCRVLTPPGLAAVHARTLLTSWRTGLASKEGCLPEEIGAEDFRRLLSPAIAEVACACLALVSE